ncbi:MAG TPA: hypothetical protein VNM90_05345, partial [Haliangium sp.]|nr:hypothetical protein [Haliangium sp.]
DLSIEALDVSFANRNGQLIGDATFHPNAALTRIVQHVQLLPASPPVLKSVATAVVEINHALITEYATPDVILRVKRGTSTVASYAVDYNVAVLDVPVVPPAADFQALVSVSAFIGLPSPKLALDPNDAVVTVPKDGSPPNFADLKAAVEKVLSQDPGGAPDLAELTLAQCRHIAHEIAWNRHIHPLPKPVRTLEEMYTAPVSSEANNERLKFEAERMKYRGVHDAEAEVLVKYVVALSAALACEKRSHNATKAGLRFPIRPDVVSPNGKIKEAEIIVEN